VIFLGDFQCDQTFSAVITKRCAEILPNRFFFTKRANSAFWNFWLCAVIVVTCYTLFGLFHGDSITKPSNNNVNIISNTFLDMKASNINDIQGLKFIFFLGNKLGLGYQDSKFSIPPENPVSHFWILITGTISIIPCPIHFHNSRYYYKLQ
jgi:hypothetical protein